MITFNQNLCFHIFINLRDHVEKNTGILNMYVPEIICIVKLIFRFGKRISFFLGFDLFWSNLSLHTSRLIGREQEAKIYRSCI